MYYLTRWEDILHNVYVYQIITIKYLTISFTLINQNKKPLIPVKLNL